ncbi:MAG: hypothetical protein C0606_14705 [Hyphomicrobiales bacterium]|nr:MAG: hypothetical protein C0606_14705 [Hyphomicrobiales bacterium]
MSQSLYRGEQLEAVIAQREERDDTCDQLKNNMGYLICLIHKQKRIIAMQLLQRTCDFPLKARKPMKNLGKLGFLPA